MSKKRNKYIPNEPNKRRETVRQRLQDLELTVQANVVKRMTSLLESQLNGVYRDGYEDGYKRALEDMGMCPISCDVVRSAIENHESRGMTAAGYIEYSKDVSSYCWICARNEKSSMPESIRLDHSEKRERRIKNE